MATTDPRGLTLYTPNLPATLEREVERTGCQLLATLDRLGFTFETQDGRIFSVQFEDVVVLDERYACYFLALQKLYHYSIPELMAKKVTDTMAAGVKKPVAGDPKRGMYAVMLEPPPPPKPLPGNVPLPDQAPEGLVYPWPFGVDREGKERWADLLETGHLLIGGKPKMGKSTHINAGLVSLLRRHSPESLQLVLVDPKVVELMPYAGLPHLARPVATSPDDAEQAVNWLVKELDRRERLFVAAGAKELAQYNKQAKVRLPLVLAVFDEVVDLVIQWGGPKSAPFRELIRVSSKARAFGIVLLLATQNPKADILDTALRENSGTRVAFHVDQAAQSKSILGRSGAEQLPPRPGRLVTDLDGRGLRKMQGFKVADEAVRDLVKQLRNGHVSPLSEVERELVVYARDQLGGVFHLRDLYAAFRGRISWRKLEARGPAWEACGWLRPPVDAVSSRTLTNDLLALVG